MVFLQEAFHHSFGVAVVGGAEIGFIFLSKAFATNGVFIVVLKDAASCKEHVVDAFRLAAISNNETTNNVGLDDFGPVVLTPIHVGSARNPSRVEHMSGPERLDLSHHS